MGILHWWISAGTKIAEGPKRKNIVQRGYSILPEDYCCPGRD